MAMFDTILCVGADHECHNMTGYILPNCSDLGYCNNFMTANRDTGSMDNFLTKGERQFRASVIHGSCSSNVPEVPPGFGEDCIPGINCPDCLVFNAYDYTLGLHATFLTKDLKIYNVGYTHGSCGEDWVNPPVEPPPELDYGLQCIVGLTCPDCIVFRPLNSTRDGFDEALSPRLSDNLMVGHTFRSCGDYDPTDPTDPNVPPGAGLDYGLQCDIP